MATNTNDFDFIGPRFDFLSVATDEFYKGFKTEQKVEQVATGEPLTGKIELTITPESTGAKVYEVKGVNAPLIDWSKVTSYIDQQLVTVNDYGIKTNEIPEFLTDPAKREVISTTDGKLIIREKIAEASNNNLPLIIAAVAILFLTQEL